MNKKLMETLHAIRVDISEMKNLIHMHMYGDNRFRAERLINEVAKKVNVMYAQCLKCDIEDRSEHDNQG